jgi:predicted outer membrane repeat protein
VAFYDSRLKAESLSNCLNRYVTPSRTIRCFDDQVPCQTIEQYASQPEMYFANNTCFYFQPGNHQLNSSLNLTNLRNISFKGLPDNIINVFLGSFVSITWGNCRLVQLTSINFILPNNYAFGFVFKQTQLIRLHNISVTANGYKTGCSAILSQRSEISIRDCRFIGILGSFGAAIMMSESSAITTGNNTFADCAAFAGGSVYLSNSILTLNGTNTFVNNTASVPWPFIDILSRYHNYNIINSKCNNGTGNNPGSHYPTMNLYTASAYGGAILCDNCTLTISEYSMFKRNNAKAGGAVIALNGRISVHDSTLFDGNSASVGGAMNLEDTNLAISGNVSLVNNSAALYGGALYISDTNISFNMDTTSKVSDIWGHGSSSMVVFQQNKASQVGGAIESHRT